MDMSVDVSDILASVPAFGDRFLRLVEGADGDPGDAATLTELADFVAGLVADLEERRPVLEGCLAAVERMALRSEEGAELVAWAFLDSLPPDDRHLLAGRLGARTRALLEEVDGDGRVPGDGAGTFDAPDGTRL